MAIFSKLMSHVTPTRLKTRTDFPIMAEVAWQNVIANLTFCLSKKGGKRVGAGKLTGGGESVWDISSTVVARAGI